MIPSLSLDLDLVLLEELAEDGSVEAPTGGAPVEVAVGSITEASAALDFAAG